MTQIRNCTDPEPEFGGQECQGRDEIDIPCVPDPIDGQWSEWKFTPCKLDPQKKIYYRNRTRECSNPEPLHGGKQCSPDNKTEEFESNKVCHAINGQWSEWKETNDSSCKYDDDKKMWTKHKFR